MDNDSQDPKFHTVQPLRDLESNWAVDLAKNLEDYLLKICSGEITGKDDEENAYFSINFAEAALLLQGSIQVYSRKVEYLYNLVLNTLEFISQTRAQEHADGNSVEPEASSSRAVQEEEDQFWVSDDVPVEGKNCLDNAINKDNFLDQFVKPPANLVVLEGDCLDSTGDGGELESYLLATNNLYRDFILLDPCDASSVDEFLKGDKSVDSRHGGSRGSSLVSKAHKSFLSPTRQSSRKSSAKKGQDNFSHGTHFSGPKGIPDDDFGPGPSNFNVPDPRGYGFELDDDHLHHEDLDDSSGDDDDDDLWRPLNPHEPGNLKVKPFRKVKASKRTLMTKCVTVASQFPLAKLRGPVSPDLTEIWEIRLCAVENQESQPPSLYEKLRECLIEGHANHDAFSPPETGDAENLYDDQVNDFDEPDFEMPDVTFMDEDVNFHLEKHDGFADNHDMAYDGSNEDPNSQASLEDLCRAHLDTLLASIAESEKQTELAARVSTWKQRIEHDMEEEDSRPPFDIHEYGESVLDKLSLDEGGNPVSFAAVVKGQEKHEIARTFSALLQLVNDRKVDLDRGTSTEDSYCYTAVNPFHVRLLSHSKGPKKMQFQVDKKRQISPTSRGCTKGETNHHRRGSLVVSSPSCGSKSPAFLSPPNCKYSVKAGGPKSTPNGKRRRRSRLVESDDVNSDR